GWFRSTGDPTRASPAMGLIRARVISLRWDSGPGGVKRSLCVLRGGAASIVNNTFLTEALGGCACNSNCSSLRRVLLSWTGTGSCSVTQWRELESGSIGVIHAARGGHSRESGNDA